MLERLNRKRHFLPRLLAASVLALSFVSTPAGAKSDMTTNAARAARRITLSLPGR